ncbi:hypothetical protein BDR07DRAFT_1492308 [Suillus spraguei]|nr:hypothetical protein BDR07DRAFT_1492308 [Suillus spraguei]
MAFFFRTVDNGIKLSSLLSIPDVSNVHAMNKITSYELNHLVTHEDPPEASQLLGHLLSHIFQPFKVPLPNDSSLDSLVPLYNTETCTWNWDPPVNPPGDKSASNTGSASSTPDPETAGSATYEEIIASFMNTLAGCLLASQSLLKCECYATHTWSTASAHKALSSSDIKCKPDLVLSDDITARWGNIRVSGKLTHSPYKPAMRCNEHIGAGLKTPYFDTHLTSTGVTTCPWPSYPFSSTGSIPCLPHTVPTAAPRSTY